MCCWLTRGSFWSGRCATCWPPHAYPARNPGQNISDLKAQVAACFKGVAAMRKLIARYGREVVDAYMGHVQDNAAQSVRRIIGRTQRRPV